MITVICIKTPVIRAVGGIAGESVFPTQNCIHSHFPTDPGELVSPVNQFSAEQTPVSLSHR